MAKLVILVALAVVHQGCASRSHLVRHGWDQRGPPIDLVELSSSGLEHVGDLTADAMITFSDGRHRRSVSASMVYAKPDLFRIDVRGPLFSRVLTALVHGDSLVVLSSGKIWRDFVSAGLLADLTTFDVGPYDIRYALLGLVRSGRLDSATGITYPRADRAVIPLVDELNARRTVWVDLHRGFVSREHFVWGGGEGEWVRELDDYRQIELPDATTLYLPSRVRITQGELAINLKFRSYAANRGVSAEALFGGIPR